MTKNQWLIIGGLGLGVVVVFCTGGALVLTTLSATPKSPELAQVVEVTATPVPVLVPATAKPIPTVQPTAQKIPTATALPTATATAQPTAISAPKATALPPIDPITYKQIEDKYNALTGIQRNSYLPTLVGKHIRWKGQVGEVQDNGDISLNVNQQGLTNTVTMNEVPKDIAVSLTRNQSIQFDAIITGADDFMGMQITLKFVSLVSK